VSDTQSPSPPYDQALANRAAAVDHCLKLGGVIIEPKATPSGFGVTVAQATGGEKK
jgi:hypothetical protein